MIDMSDTLQDEGGTPSRSNSLKISLPTVLCTDGDAPDNPTVPDTNSFVTSESKLSLPSNFGTPTSPFRISSPISLPTSPKPFGKGLQTRSNKSLDEPQSSENQTSTMNKPLLDTGSATVISEDNAEKLKMENPLRKPAVERRARTAPRVSWLWIPTMFPLTCFSFIVFVKSGGVFMTQSNHEAVLVYMSNLPRILVEIK
ncbi:jg17295 [Pararge aegeria aegeria]|uniref:Jg17295 protein n=1 Tax=Pararge aegeria aegeria TaxID=348720 RepID=A0A8S4R078_9NEOP|nr:jg17295 [Pararge aegeria aegeria]